LYKCNDGTGYLVLSSQGNSMLKIYERQGANTFLKTVERLDHLGSGGLQTDGVDANSAAIAPNFPNGLLAVNDGPAKRFHLYDWADAAGNDLAICPDGRIPEACEGDFGGDGDVDGDDLAWLIANFSLPLLPDFASSFGRVNCP